MRVLVLTVLGVLLCAACGDDAAGAAPEGYTRYESEALTFAYPQEWTVQQGAGGDARQVEVRDDREQGALRAGVAAYRTALQAPIELDQYVETANLELNVRTPEREVVRVEQFALADGTDARLVEVTYSSDAGGTPTPVRELAVFALHDGDGLVLRCAVAEDRYADYADDCRAVAESFAPAS